MKRWTRQVAERFYNWIRGYGFYWARDEHGWYWAIKKGTCPYPVLFDWSAKACIKAGECGCDERCKVEPLNRNISKEEI